jgi:hypothetical protein
MRAFTIGLAVATVLLLTATLALGAQLASARPVSLSDARSAPDALVYVRPGATVSLATGCVVTERQAYSWRGLAVRQTVARWHGVRVTNVSHRPILAAGWCS